MGKEQFVSGYQRNGQRIITLKNGLEVTPKDLLMMRKRGLTPDQLLVMVTQREEKEKEQKIKETVKVSPNPEPNWVTFGLNDLPDTLKRQDNVSKPWYTKLFHR